MSVKIESFINGTNRKAVVSFLFSNFNKSPTEIVKSISSNFKISCDSLFQASNFSGVKRVESLTPKITRFPSSPNLFKKVLYSRLTIWSSGNKFASVVENLMFTHCVDNPKVITAMRIRRKVLFLKINRASALQNPILKSLFT